MREELLKKWSALGYQIQEEEFNGIQLDDLIWVYRKLKSFGVDDVIKKRNLIKILDAARMCFIQNDVLFYIALEDGSPYQESSEYGATYVGISTPSIHVFSNKEDATTYADETNKAIQNVNGRVSQNVVKAQLLGVNQSFNNVYAIKQFAIKNIVVGLPVDNINTSLSVEKMNFPLDEKGKYFALAPYTRFLIGAQLQSREEQRPLKEVSAFNSLICTELAKEKIGLAIDRQTENDDEVTPCLFIDKDTTYLDAFTDWTALEDNYFDNSTSLAVCTMDIIAEQEMPVVLNRSIILSADFIQTLLMFTEKGAPAAAYIAKNYKLDSQTDSGFERISSIFFDIYKSPIWEEYASTVKFTDDFSDITFSPANEDNAVKVHDMTAHKLLQSGLCENPAAAYHVMSLLLNDKDGSAYEKFQKAELYE